MKNRRYFKNVKKRNHTQTQPVHPLVIRAYGIVKTIGFVIAWVIAVIMLCIFTGCATQKRCNQLYPPIESRHDSTIIQKEVILKDTTIFRTLPPDTVTIFDYLADNSLFNDTITAENSHAIAKSWIRDGRLWLRVFNKPQPIPFSLPIKETREKNTRTVIVTKIERVQYVSRWHQWCGYLIISQIIAGVAVLVHEGLKFRKKVLGI